MKMANNYDASQQPAAPTAPAAHSGQLGLQERVVAAAGASVLSALVVNPLDVVKVRMQVQAAAAPQPQSMQAYCFHHRLPVRSLHHASRMALMPMAGLLNKLTANSSSSGITQGWQLPKECLCSTAGVGALPLDSLAEDGALTRSKPTFGEAECQQLKPARRQVHPGTIGTLRTIMKQDGLHTLWRGLDSALLMSVPTVLLYYPLYDSLMSHLSSIRGHTTDSASWQLSPSAAPVLSGAIARTVTVLAVAPLEFVRTRQQAGPASLTPALNQSATAAMSTWQTLRVSLHGDVGAQVEAASLRGLLNSLPRLWTGLGATIARDVPFSAIYWGLVEPIRTSLLETNTATSAPHTQLSHQHVSELQQAPDSISASGAAGTAAHHTSPADDTYDLPGRALTTIHRDLHVSEAPLEDLKPLHVTPVHVAPVSDQAPSHSQLLLANLVAGSLAGAAAAAATTPFDVVKTRMQLAPAGQAATSTAAVLQEVWQQQGVRGLFVGMGPRALRCAPACAIVIACYEVLKRAMSTT